MFQLTSTSSVHNKSFRSHASSTLASSSGGTTREARHTHSSVIYECDHNALPEKIVPVGVPTNPYLLKHPMRKTTTKKKGGNRRLTEALEHQQQETHRLPRVSPRVTDISHQYTLAHMSVCRVCRNGHESYFEFLFQSLRVSERDSRLALEKRESSGWSSLQTFLSAFHPTAKAEALVTLDAMRHEHHATQAVHDKVSFLKDTERFTRRAIYRDSMQILRALARCAYRTGDALQLQLDENRARREAQIKAAREAAAERESTRLSLLRDKVKQQLRETLRDEVRVRCTIDSQETIESVALFLTARDTIARVAVEARVAQAKRFFFDRVAFEDEDLLASRREIEDEERSARHRLRVTIATEGNFNRSVGDVELTSNSGLVV
eukprot:PhM_4_TR6483/c0_g1_i1/m.7037